jgi:hypothetical protein
MLRAVDYDSVRKRKKQIGHCVGQSGNFAERLILFAAVEGIFFSGSFCSIFLVEKSVV